MKWDSSSEGSNSPLSMSDFLYQQTQMTLYCFVKVIHAYCIIYYSYIYIADKLGKKCHDNWRRLRFRQHRRFVCVSRDQVSDVITVCVNNIGHAHF